MDFIGKPFLPEPHEHSAYLAAIRRHVAITRTLRAGDVLSSFFGAPLDPASFRIDGLHHVAVYAGDYRSEEALEHWFDHLRRADGITDVCSGPSYIAPRYYGTPGYWLSCRLDGAAFEVFANKHSGPWKDLDHPGKISRMSHLALSVEAPEHVKPLLDYFSHDPLIDLLSFSPRDEAGHTYGHLFHRATQRVLELVHAA